jgi:hypothetical protein
VKEGFKIQNSIFKNRRPKSYLGLGTEKGGIQDSKFNIQESKAKVIPGIGN